MLWSKLMQTISERRHGLGQHADTVSKEDNVKLMQLLYISILVYNMGLFAVKTSLLCQYLRFFVARAWRVTCHILLVIIACGGVAFITTSIFSCKPVAKFWNFGLQGRCVNLQGITATC